MAATDRTLDYCGVRALVGRELADEMFDRRIPSDVDMDHLPSQEAVAQRVREREAQEHACAACPDLNHCHD